MINFLGMALYGDKAASTRQRLLQYIPELAKHDIQYDIDIPIFLNEIRSFFNGEWREEHYIHYKLILN